MKFNDFRDFTVWQKTYDLVLSVYKVTAEYPSEERFGIISDMRRAANSITHNIAEGYGRFGAKDKTRFYKFARRSAYELQSQALVSFGLDFIKQLEIRDKIFISAKEIIEELNNVIKTVETKNNK